MRRDVVARVLDNDPLLTTAEAAEVMRVDPATVTRYVAEGKLTAIRTLGGGGYRFRESVIRKWLKEEGTGGK